MKFGSVQVGQAAGCILAHSVMTDGCRYRKGTVLTAGHIERLSAAGVTDVTVAELSEGDIGEDEAASRIADALLEGTEGFSRTAAFTGRANIYADLPGVVSFDTAAVGELNSINPAVTLATLPNFTRVAPRSMVATAKIITFAVPASDLDRAIEASRGLMKHCPVRRVDASLVVTRVEGQANRLVEKGRSAVAARLTNLGIELRDTHVVPHRPDSVRDALESSEGSLLLILTGSATSDLLDVGPEGLRQAGGRVHRFGIPVDPGNLLFHGELGDRPVIGLPGCARSPALNGADWVLERIACGIRLTDRDLAEMGVGGLLKEIPSRPQPRSSTSGPGLRPRIAALILVESCSDALRDILEVAGRSDVDDVRIAGPETVCGQIEHALPDASGFLAVAETVGRSGLIKAGIGSLGANNDAVLLIRSGDPVPAEGLLNKMIAAFSPEDGREIVMVSTAGSSRRGPPILFGKRFFESLSGLSGDRGGADLLPDARDFVCEIHP